MEKQALIVLSVPYTGTRFTCGYLDSLPVKYKQLHTDVESLNELFYRSGNFKTGQQTKAIIPVRDPLLTFVSTFLRTREVPADIDIKPALDNVVLNYNLLMQIEDWYDFTYLRLDCEDKVAELTKIAQACGKDYDPSFIWKPVGSLSDKATDHKLVDIITKDWPKEIIATIHSRLQTAREHYGYA